MLLVQSLGALYLVFELVTVLWRVSFYYTLALDVAKEAIGIQLLGYGVDLFASQLVCKNGAQVDAAVLFFEFTDKLERLCDRLLQDRIQVPHLILLLLEYPNFP